MKMSGGHVYRIRITLEKFEFMVHFEFFNKYSTSSNL